MNRTRPSSYIIFTHLDDGNTLLIHGYTGAYCLLPKKTALKNLTGGSFAGDSSYSEGGLSGDQLDTLKQSGFLTDLAFDEEERFFTKIVRNIQKQKMWKIPLFTIVPSYQCNFNCSYCYESDMREMRGDEFLSKRMNKETADLILKAIGDIERKKDKSESEKTNICFYGGEPFLPENRDIIAYIITEAKNKFDTAFSAISNGYELDYYREYLKPEIFDNIQITLDGAPAIHNRRRCIKTSSGDTFGRIAENVTLALDHGVKISIRVNIDDENIHSLPELQENILRRGWNKYKEFKFTAAAVFDSREKYSHKSYYSSGELSMKLADIKKACPDLEMMLLQDEDYLRQVGTLFTKTDRLTSLFKYNYCSAPTNMFVFDPFGDIYPCMEKVGKPGESVGYFDDDGDCVFIQDKHENWQKRTVASSEKCKNCAYALFCGGGCANKAEQLNGTIHSHHCDGFKSLFNRKIAESFTASRT